VSSKNNLYNIQRKKIGKPVSFKVIHQTGIYAKFTHFQKKHLYKNAAILQLKFIFEVYRQGKTPLRRAIRVNVSSVRLRRLVGMNETIT